MRPPNSRETYLQQVLQQIRWKRARQIIGRELQNHLEDQYGTLLEAGLSPDQAEAETVRQMGDPVSVGKALDGLHRPHLEWKLLCPLVLLLGCGGFFCLSLSGFQWSQALSGRLWGLGLGVILGALLYFWDAKPLLDKPVQLAFLLALIPLFARRFYSSAFDLTFDQGLLLLPLAMGLLVCAMRGHGWRGISAGLGLEFLLILDSVQARAFYFTCFLVLFSLVLLLHQAVRDSQGRSRFLGIGLVLAFHAAVVLVFWNLRSALTQVLPANSTEFGTSSLPWRVFWNSGWFASGAKPLTSSETALLQDRFALTWLAHQYGMAAALLLWALLLAFFVLGFGICRRQSTPFGRYCSLSILSTLAFESLGYFAQCMIGLPAGHFFLPLVDTSGPALTLTLALLGLLLGLFRQNSILDPRQLRHWFLGEAVC